MGCAQQKPGASVRIILYFEFRNGVFLTHVLNMKKLSYSYGNKSHTHYHYTAN